MGAVFNRDFPGNRDRRPLPPTIKFFLNNLEFYVVSYEKDPVLIALITQFHAMGYIGYFGK